MKTSVSLTAYAKLHGASRQAATKWRDRGALVMKGDLVQVAASDDKMKAVGLGRFKHAEQTPQPDPQPTPQPVAGGAQPPADGDDNLEERLLAGNVLTKVQAETVKESALALKHLVAVRKEAGQLLEADAVERVVFEESQKARDAWLNFPSKVAPMLAADLGIDAGLIAEALTAHVHKQLENLGEPAFDFGKGEG